jgi:hypothetical protein
MRYLQVLLVVLLISTQISCRKEEQEKPKVIYDSSKVKPTVTAKIDTSQIAIADLPIQITGTDYLLHPVGDLRLYEGRAGSSRSASESVSYNISNYSEFEVTGYLRNIKFQRKGTDSLVALTDRPMMIQSATFLRPIADKFKQQLFIYTLHDSDTNKDGRLDQADIKSLYISKIGGEGLQKLSAELHELIDWKYVDANNRVYFRTVEDINKNGEFDKNDVLHYHYVDLSAKQWVVVEYQPN